MLAGLALLIAAAAPVVSVAGEPPWWTQEKRDCRSKGGTISEYYNDAAASGGCHPSSRPSNRATPPAQPSPEVLAREKAKRDAADADRAGQQAAASGNWSEAVDSFTESLNLNPDDAVRERLNYARKRLADANLAPQIDQFRRQNHDRNVANRTDAFRDSFRAQAARNRSHAPVVLSPSQNLEPWTRAAFERQFTILEARRMRAEAELVKIDAARAMIHSAAADNQRMIEELTEDSVSDVLDVLQGILAVTGEQVPAPAKQQIDALLNMAQFSAHGYSAARAEPGSERQSKEALDAIVGLTGALTPVAPRGVTPQQWEALRYCVGDMARLMKSAHGSQSFPADGPRLKRLAQSMDQLVEIAGSLPIVGLPIAGARGAGQLLQLKLSGARLRLMSDRGDLDAARVNVQSAHRFWVTRLGEIKAQEAPYRASLGIKAD
jgi:hypothetical protein